MPNVQSEPMDEAALERARKRLAAASEAVPDRASLEGALERAREQLEAFAGAVAELEATVPERVESALRDALQAQVLPVARQIAEVRGLSGQTIRRLERLETNLDADQKARVEDLALLVELIASGWRGVDRRLDRLERGLDRLERGLEDRPSASLYRLGDRKTGA
jgi:tetratricopeptide (TPR) repeat protein